jgi:hypothetical protein
MNHTTTTTSAAPSQRSINLKKIANWQRGYAPDVVPSGPPNVYALAEAAREIASRLHQPPAHALAETLAAAAAAHGDVDFEAIFELMANVDREEQSRSVERERVSAPPPSPPRAWTEVAQTLGVELTPRADDETVTKAARDAFAAHDEVRRLFLVGLSKGEPVDDETKRRRYALVSSLGAVEPSFVADAAVIAPSLPASRLPLYDAANVRSPEWLPPLARQFGFVFPPEPRQEPMPEGLSSDQRETVEQRVIAKRAAQSKQWRGACAKVHAAFVRFLDGAIAQLHERQLGCMEAYIARELRAYVANERTTMDRDVVLGAAKWALRCVKS